MCDCWILKFKERRYLQFDCNKSKEKQIIYEDGGLKTWSTLFVPVGSGIWNTDAAHISVIELGSQRPGKGGAASMHSS